MLNLHSKPRQRLLLYYFTNPQSRHHLRDLAQRLDVDPSNLSKELRHLEEEGLFLSETEGRQKYFTINKKYPLFPEIKRIVEKTIGIVNILGETLEDIDGIDQAWLYGSFASNQQDMVSDIDILVIGKPKVGALAESLRPLEPRFGREINYTTMPREEFKSRRSRKDAFLENIWHNKRILLAGSE